MNVRNSKYLKKLLTLCIIVGTVPVLILGIFSYFKSSDTIQKKVNEANLQGLLQSEMRVEEILKSIHNYYVIVANSATVNNYLNKDINYTDYDEIIEMQKVLSGIQSVGSSVKSSYFVNFNKNWVIGTDGVSSVEDKINKDNFMTTLNNSKSSFWTYNTEQSVVFKQLNSLNTLDNIYLIVKVPYNFNKPSGAIVVNLLGYEFYNKAVKGDRNQDIIILDDNYRVVTRDGNKEFDNDKGLNVFIAGLKTQAEEYGYYKAKFEGKEVGISFRKSKYNNWTYASIYSIDEITKDSRAIGIVTIIICVLMLLCVFIVSIFGSRLIYSPIRNIYDIIMKSIDILNNDKSKDEVKCIDEGINTLFKNQSKMIEQINIQWLQLEELYLIRLVNGELQEHEINEKIKSLGYHRVWKWLCVILILIDSFDGTEYSENDRELIMLSINSIICECVNSDSRFRPTLTNKVQVVLIGGDHDNYDEFKEHAYSISNEIQNRVRVDLNLGVSIGISRPYEELRDTQIAYKESMEALMCRFKFGEEAILCFDDVQPNSSIRQLYPKKMEEELTDAINQGDIEKSNSVLSQLVDEILKEKLSFSEYQLCLTRIFINIIGILQDFGESINVLSNKQNSLLGELYKLRSSCEVKKWFNLSVIVPVVTILEERRGSQYKNILDKVMNMVHEEYDKDLSLEICAERLNYHPSYVWRILKKEMNITFTDYLAQYRLTKAKKWLEETNISVLEISEKLKYNNSQNFIRYFKKLEGMTPGQYRDNCKANNNNITNSEI